MSFSNKQFIFLDTPGIFGSNARLSRSTFKQASNAILECDLVILMLDVVKKNFANTIEILKYINSLEKEIMIVINKVDLLKKNEYFKKLDNIQKVLDANNLISISALKSIGINSLIRYIEKNFNFFYKEIAKINTNIIGVNLLLLKLIIFPYYKFRYCKKASGIKKP